MASSIYVIPTNIAYNGKLGKITLTDAGSNYTAITVGITDPDGVTATASIEITEGVVTSLDVINPGSGYTLPAPVVTIVAPASGITATATANISNGSVISLTLTNPGSGYKSVPAVTIATPVKVTAVATGTESGGEIQPIFTITEAGKGYASAPTIVLTDGSNNATATASLSIIDSKQKILATNIPISAEQLVPGGGGILRIYFSFAFTGGTSTRINVLQGSTSTLKGTLNADNNNVIESDGYYRFDIDVESGDLVNFEPDGDSISKINFFRAHLVVFGA